MKIVQTAFVALATIFSVSCGGNNENKINEALAQYDFETARKYVGNNKDVPEQLTRAEVSFKLSNGQVDAAQATAREDGCPELFNMMYADYISKLIGEGKLDKSLSALMSWNFYYTPSDKNRYFKNEEEAFINPHRLSKRGSGEGWELYNEEAEQYNALLDKLMTAYLLEEDKASAKKCVLLYAPTYVPPMGRFSDYNPQYLKNIAQGRAKEKLK